MAKRLEAFKMDDPNKEEENYPLGPFRQTFQPRALPGMVLLFSAIFCGLMFVVETYTAIHKYLGPSDGLLSGRYRRDAILIAAILGMVFFILTVALSALYYSHKKSHVDLHEYGIRVVTWRKATAFPWMNIDDIKVEPIFGRSQRPVNWDYQLTRDDGARARFRGLEDMEFLAKRIERKVA
jgi:hypothetical protein